MDNQENIVEQSTTENVRPVNAGKPWTQDEIDLIAGMVPNWDNGCRLAKVLGRTPHAIQYMWSKIYWPVTKLKEYAKDDTKSQQYTKILKARRKADICIRCQ